MNKAFTLQWFILAFNIRPTSLIMDHQPIEIRTVSVVRYVTPLREGGSLPAIAEADDGFLYVLKFRGAGQGVKALIAELIGGEIARALGLKVPEIVLANLDEAFGRTEPDEEIQDLLKASVGQNVALHYLSGAITFDPVVNNISAKLASTIVWLDCLLTNVDRTVRNTNLLMWRGDLWLIDHGAALYFHHSWQNLAQQSNKPFPMVKDHVLLPYASELIAADAECKAILTVQKIDEIVSLIPDSYLADSHSSETAEYKRAIYSSFLHNRLQSSHQFVNEAQNARKELI